MGVKKKVQIRVRSGRRVATAGMEEGGSGFPRVSKLHSAQEVRRKVSSVYDRITETSSGEMLISSLDFAGFQFEVRTGRPGA